MAVTSCEERMRRCLQRRCLNLFESLQLHCSWQVGGHEGSTAGVAVSHGRGLSQPWGVAHRGHVEGIRGSSSGKGHV